MYFNLALVKKDIGHFIPIKGAICQEEITINNLYVPNVSAASFIKHTLKDLKSHRDPNTGVVRDFNTPLSLIDRSSRPKINKELNDTIDLVEHPATLQYTSSQQPMELSPK
jgi:hypothetical protein